MHWREVRLDEDASDRGVDLAGTDVPPRHLLTPVQRRPPWTPPFDHMAGAVIAPKQRDHDDGRSGAAWCLEDGEGMEMHGDHRSDMEGEKSLHASTGVSWLLTTEEGSVRRGAQTHTAPRVRRHAGLWCTREGTRGP